MFGITGPSAQYSTDLGGFYPLPLLSPRSPYQLPIVFYTGQAQFATKKFRYFCKISYSFRPALSVPAYVPWIYPSAAGPVPAVLLVEIIVASGELITAIKRYREKSWLVRPLPPIFRSLSKRVYSYKKPWRIARLAIRGKLQITYK